MHDHRVAPQVLPEKSPAGGGFLPIAYWLDQDRVGEAALWEAVRTRTSSDSANLPIEDLLAEARRVSGMDSTFLARDNAIARCMNGGPLKLVQGQSLEWFPAVCEELAVAGSWQTHALGRERADAPPGLPLRVKTLFVLAVKGFGTSSAVTLCGISQMRIVMDSTQLKALERLSGQLSAVDYAGTEGVSPSDVPGVPKPGGQGRARKTARRGLFGHVFGGRDAVTRRIARA